MAPLHDLTRFLLTAGGTVDPEGDGAYLLYIDSEDGFLELKHWTGTRYGDEDVIAQDIRPGSTASYVLSSPPTIMCISSSNTIRALKYDMDGTNWVEDESIPTHAVHSNSHITAGLDINQRLQVAFQDPTGCLVIVDDSWTRTVLPAEPVLGTPLFKILRDGVFWVCYVSVQDKRIHMVSTHEDQIMVDHPLTETLKRMIILPNQSGQLEAFCLTNDDSVVQVTIENGQGTSKKLGIVTEGKFEPTSDAENVKAFILSILNM